MKHRDAKPSVAAPAVPPSDAPRVADEEVLSSLRELQNGQAKLLQGFQDAYGQNAFLRQQTSQLIDSVRQLYGAVSAQCVQLRDSDQAIQDELKRFQTGGPQRAMAGVFHKLVRDLLKHMNQLDDLTRLTETGDHSDSERPWMEAIRVARGNLESILGEWGCIPLPISVGRDAFDPEIHEAVASAASSLPPSSDGNRVAEVVRRGWLLSGTLVQHPQVIVN